MNQETRSKIDLLFYLSDTKLGSLGIFKIAIDNWTKALALRSIPTVDRFGNEKIFLTIQDFYDYVDTLINSLSMRQQRILLKGNKAKRA